MTTRSFRGSSRLLRAAFLLTFWCPLLPASGGNLRTVQRTIHSYGHGDRTVSCLAIDGGLVPLILPNGAILQPGSEIKILWPKDRSFATFRAASPREIALMDMMDKPQAPVHWKRYVAEIIGDDADQYAVCDFQTNILAVNHWRMGMMAMDYSLLGVRSCCLLLLWRCRDGSTITVIMRTGFSDYKTHRQELFSMIGGAMLMAE